MITGDYYDSPIGEMLLLSENEALTGCYFVGQKHYPYNLDFRKKENTVLSSAKTWLDLYFNRNKPNFIPNFCLNGTPFQTEIWNYLMQIPYGKLVTYGEIASIIGTKRGVTRLSSQAVGNAIGANPISVFIPCHRVLNSKSEITGYAAGIDKKISLLELEGHTIMYNSVNPNRSIVK